MDDQQNYSSCAQACKALISAGLESPEDMSLISKQECRQLLRDSGYDRYDDKTAGFLVDDAHLLLTHYKGDFGKLRDAAGRDPAQERLLLKKFKGIGDGGVDIFFREAQLVWDEIYPFADKKALKAARLVGFREHPKVLAELCQNDIPTFVRLVAALVRMELSKSYNDVQSQAQLRPPHSMPQS
ncbi:hypothetical protein APUTEX25_000979 [Auxenochlorella protothecoides]|uniref:Uncharacterized protein n=1 Tax=Auxenochlorella protothecoides TaxID=3075 RepID=A0A3M7KSV6_AUXPR|nr:hypothetical protein APUTEX25_000979 [Auxenochlorella protothecoides]|eukprot:RMZ52860.1 hypothetical protein APUTEX25_000979 [Auxenochlorella protothecoides]